MAKKTKIEKGKVFIQTDRGVFPYSVLEKAEIKTSSKQIEKTTRWLAENDLIPHPYPPETLLALYESNSIFYRCVNQLAIDVAGLGWHLELIEGKAENKTERAEIEAFLKKPNADMAMRTILKQALVNWGSIGWFALEVVRSIDGKVSQVYHVPAHTIRVHKSKKKYCQKRGTQKVWFKKFGETRDINAKTGKQGKVAYKERATELIFYKNYYPLSDYYGVPNAIAATGDIIGLIGMRDYNLAFFENYGVPSAIITLEGEWEDGSDRKVSDFLNKELKGSKNAHRTLVVKQPDNCKFTYKALGKEVKEGSFKLYEKARREDIMIAYSMPPERIGVRAVGQLGANVAEESTKIYVQGVVEPLQLDMETIINTMLLDSETYEFKFEDIDLRNYDADVERMNSEIEHGTRTPNEARVELGRKPYPEGDKFYIASTMVEVGAPIEPLSKKEAELIDELDD